MPNTEAVGLNRTKLFILIIISLSLSISTLSGTAVFARETLEVGAGRPRSMVGSDISVYESESCRELDTQADGVISDADEAYDINTSIEILTSASCIESDLREYLIMNVMSEMPYTWEKEALRAQAIACRTYSLNLMIDGTRHGENTVCTDSTHCSAVLTREEYISRYGNDEYEKAYAAVSEAVDSTDGYVMTYNGELCTAVYHSSSRGTTESSYALWGTYTPYLVSVSTPEITEAQVVRARLEKLCGGCSGNVSIRYNESGRCESMTVGERDIPASELRSALGLRSSDIEIYVDGDEVVFTVYGYGHGIGMSQYGANEMAKQGSDARDILTHYYTGVTLERMI